MELNLIIMAIVIMGIYLGYVLKKKADKNVRRKTMNDGHTMHYLRTSKAYN